MSTGDGNTTSLVPTKDDNTINVPSINKGRVIKRVGGHGLKIDYIHVVNANKIAESKNLIKDGVGFVTPEARLAFTKLG